MKMTSFRNSVLATSGAELAINAMKFLTTIYIVRSISTSSFGIYALILSVSITLCYLTSLGLPQAIVYFIGKQRESRARLVSTHVWMCCGIGVVVSIIVYLWRAYPLGTVLKELPAQYLVPVLVLYVLLFVDSSLLSVVRGLKNFAIYNIRRLLNPAFNLLGVLLMFLAFGPSLKSLVAVYIVVTVCMTCWLGYYVFVRMSFEWRFDPGIAGRLLRYGFKSYAQLLAGHLIYQIDIYMLAYLLGADEIAFYVIAVGVATALWHVPNTVGTILFPTLASVHDEREIHIFAARTCRHTVFITALLAVCLGIAGKVLITVLYGDEYLSSVNALLIILPGIVAMSVYKVLTRDFSSRNRQQINVMAASVSLAVNIVLNILWIPRYGINGAALASTVSYGLASAILVGVLSVQSKIPARKMLIVGRADVAAYREAFAKLMQRVSKTSNSVRRKCNRFFGRRNS